MQSVREELSRRNFLTVLGGTVAAAAIAPVSLAAQAKTEKPIRLPKGFRDIYDMTYTFSPKLPVFPSFKPMQMEPRFSIAKDGFFASQVTFDEHTGTHMDAPMHFINGGLSADRLPVDTLFAPLAVVDISARASKDPDATVSVDDLLAWERAHGRLPNGAFVAMHSGWDGRVGDPEKFLNKDAKGTMHAPGFGEAAAHFLTEQRNIVGVGVDTLSLDATAAPKSVAHLTILGAGKYGVELLANLTTVPPAGATIIVGAPKHEGASGGPVRVFVVA